MGEGGGNGGGGRERLYTYRYTVTTRMTPGLRLAAMRAILMFHNCEGQSHKTVSTEHNFWRERRAEADSNRSPSAYQPSALPLGQTGSPHPISVEIFFYTAFLSLASAWKFCTNGVQTTPTHTFKTFNTGSLQSSWHTQYIRFNNIYQLKLKLNSC